MNVSPYLRLRQICLAAEHLEPAVQDLQAIFGLQVCYRDPSLARYGLVNAVLPIGHQFIEVVAPERDGTAAGRFLASGRGGAYMLILDCDDLAARERHAASLGVRIVNRIIHGDYTGLQLHPQDTGATMLEFNHTVGGASPMGPYHPAGPYWQEAAGTGDTRGIAAVEIQSPVHATLASRWADLLQRPLEGQAIALDDGIIRFVAATTQAPARLGRVELAVADPLRTRERARERERLNADGSIGLGGVDFVLAA